MSAPVGPSSGDDRVRGALALARRELHLASAPDPEFRAALRTRLLAVHAVQTAAPPVPPGRLARLARRPHRLRTTLLAGALSLAVGLTGVGVATTRSLPGEPLYGAKRTVETLRLRTADGPLETGLAHLHLAERRLREVRALAQGRDSLAQAGSGPTPVLAARAPTLADGRADAVREALTEMDEQTRTGSRLVLQVARDTGDATPLRVLQAWSGQQVQLLRDVAPELPGAAREPALASLSVLAGVGTRATALLGPSG